MSFGLGEQQVTGYGDADSWGGPLDGIDVVEHISGLKTKVSARIPSDAYMFIIVAAALGILWVLGGVVFKSARI